MIKKMVRIADIQTHFDDEFLENKDEMVAKGVKRYVEKGGFSHPIPIDPNYNLLGAWVNFCVAVELGLKRVECEIGTADEYQQLKDSRNPYSKLNYESNMNKGQRRKRAVYINAKGRCQICGKRLALDNMTIDHITPVAKDGKNGIENLQSACKECNLMKANMMPEVFYMRTVQIATYKAQSDEQIAAELYHATWNLLVSQMKRKMLSLML